MKTISEMDAMHDGEAVSFQVRGVTFRMIKVEGGTFTMGATPEQGEDARPDERPSRKVTLSPFMIGETPVTQSLWTAVSGCNPSSHRGGSLPVENVSWEDCRGFLKELGSLTGLRFSLPAEAQWEFAARGGNRSGGYKYSGSDDIGEVAWYDMDSGIMPGNRGLCTHEVKTKAPNELGLYDMSGNIFEWCRDWYADYRYAGTVDPEGPYGGNHRVMRGGCFNIVERCCRISYRSGSSSPTRMDYCGLRLVL